jgi:hypothetical protein
MGEIADMMLDGLLDEESGEYIGDINKERFGCESPGFPVSYERSSKKNSNPIARKLLSRLELIGGLTDSYSGMYPGDYYDEAKAQHDKLLKRGLIEFYYPHNQSHSTRVVITVEGREILSQQRER